MHAVEASRRESHTTSRSGLIALTLATLIAVATLGLGSPRFVVLRPHLGALAIARAGESIAIEVTTSIPFWRPEWRVWVDGPRGRRELAIEQVEMNLRGARQRLLVALPDDLGVGGLDLTVEAGALRRYRPQALHVVTGYPQRVRFVQLADLPVLGDQGSGEAAMGSLIDEINLIAPDFVLFTGDVIYGDPEDGRYQVLVDLLHRLEPPAIVAPGNHEYKGWSRYLQHFVEPWHVVDFGHLRLISLNSGHGRDQLTLTQERWLVETLADSGDRTPIVQVHHPPFGPRGVARLPLAALRDTGCPLVLSGHLHHDALFDIDGRQRSDSWQFPGPRFAVTTAAGQNDLRPGSPGSTETYAGYRLIRMDGGEVVSMTYDRNGDGERDAISSYPSGLIRVTRPAPGSALVENGFNEALDRARVRIEAPASGPRLRADRGRIVDILPSSAGEQQYVVEIDLPAESRTVITLIEESPE